MEDFFKEFLGKFLEEILELEGIPEEMFKRNPKRFCGNFSE